jgi:hypothetical protein
MCEESMQARGARRQREERGSAAMAAGGGSSRNKATVSTAHCVCVCECVGSRFSPPSVSFGRNKKNYSDKRAVSWMDENITLTKSSGLMKALR